MTANSRIHFEDGATTIAAAFFTMTFDECVPLFLPSGQIVDARLTLVFRLLHDLNCDQWVDWEDWFHFSECQYGPEEPHDAGCERFDANADGDVDLADAASLQRLFTGSTE